ncbi:MAG: T9SS type A sorting domain-containing protein [Bacteroidetes bacterium]|nr:T9SS type A sorting domain-containing protein [Bacteroidota bacterium]
MKKTKLFSNTTHSSVHFFLENLSGNFMKLPGVSVSNCIYSLKLINVQGEMIMEENQLSGIDDFDCSSLSPGMYFIEIFEGNEKHIYKLIIQ